MQAVVIYFAVCLVVAIAAFVMKLGPISQVLVLAMGLAIFPLQKYIHRSPIKDLGFCWCSWSSVLAAVVIPIGILGSIALIDLLTGVARLHPLGELKNPFNTGAPFSSVQGFGGFVAVYALILFVIEFVSEELMFRGYILGTLTRLGYRGAIGISAVMFSIWHIPIAVWEVGFEPVRTCLYLVNMLLLGLVFGRLFLRTKSLIPVALCHALWNDLEYNLFGFANQQMLIVGSTRTLFDPEEGILGTAFLAATYLLLKPKGKIAPAPAMSH